MGLNERNNGISGMAKRAAKRKLNSKIKENREEGCKMGGQAAEENAADIGRWPLFTEDRTAQYAPGWQPYLETPGKEAREEYRYKTADELQSYLLPSSWVETVRLIRYQGEDGDNIMTFELLYLAFAIYSFLKNTYYYVKNVVEAFKSNTKKRNPVKRLLYTLLGRFWDFVDLFFGILGICSVIAYILRVLYIDQALENFEVNNGNAYINLSLQRNVELMFTFCVAGVVFFTSCKMIKILRFNRRISVLADTLNYAGVSMTDFAVVFVVIICAFNVSLYCLLWNKLESYRSAVATFETTIAGMLGKFVVADMFQITMLASIIFMIFMYCGTLFLINIFVMIVLYEFEQILRSVGMYGREDMPACYVQDTMRDFEILKKLDAYADLLLHRVCRWQQMDEDDFVIPPRRAQDIPELANYS
ncbi:transporter, cation channel family protein [Oesophagostomum dentatum]|uniref:Transporter, cation channel family protein n=1 Tax=Oesophagostomum dentatum TaxID=61180 RepID=A0A0B1TIW9_OESDE|nr:transporter, cation channel family protein [Oesophagostomum dentatum]